jgi:hypothetical protein
VNENVTVGVVEWESRVGWQEVVKGRERRTLDGWAVELYYTIEIESVHLTASASFGEHEPLTVTSRLIAPEVNTNVPKKFQTKPHSSIAYSITNFHTSRNGALQSACPR